MCICVTIRRDNIYNSNVILIRSQIGNVGNLSRFNNSAWFMYLVILSSFKSLCMIFCFGLTTNIDIFASEKVMVTVMDNIIMGNICNVER